MKSILWNTATRYEMFEMLGEGAYSQVFRAERSIPALGMKQNVAVKVLQSRNAVEMWRNEFASLALVRSSYCIQVFAFEQLERGPALILEYIEGLNLRDLVHYGTLTNELCAEILTQVQLGLSDLAHFGLCHGDLSPKNIMIDINGCVRLLDFGLANMKVGEVPFTPGFAAPELLIGSPPSLQTDYYSLGSIAQFLQRLAGFEEMDSVTPLLASDPQQRAPAHFKTNLATKAMLGMTVRQALMKRQSLRDLKTKTAQVIRKIHKPLLHLQAFIMVCLVAFSSSSQTKQTSPGYGSIRVRTQSWHSVSIDGKAFGYAPLDINYVSTGEHWLHWVNAKGSGDKKIEVKDFQTTVLDEKALSSY
jgi:serine/threonine protein kinase